MIERLVALALRLPVVVLCLAFGLVGGGLWAYSRLDIEAYPNPVPPLVEVITQVDGWSAEEVERYITIPLEVGLSGIKGLTHVRSQSLFGLSDVKCYFDWDTDYWASRQEVINRLGFIDLPGAAQATISPWNAIGEVMRYTLEGEGYRLDELKAAQDWILERQFRQVRGVVDVTSFGGETRQYQVEVDPFRLRGQKVTLAQLQAALTNANLNVGGQRLSIGEQSYDIRGVGLLRNVHDIEDVVITEQSGVPIRVSDVAQVRLGAAPRLGFVSKDEQKDVVQGVVLMRYGAETPDTLSGIYKQLEHIDKAHLLPPGMKIVPYYDRGALVETTTHTVMENITLGILLVVGVLFLFLGSFKAALITSLNIPLALMVAFIGIVLSGGSANLISMGAVDFGIVVDSTVIMMENLFHHLGPGGKGGIRDRILLAAREVGRPMAFSTAIVGVSFLPLFTMTGVSGVIFSPMARTYAMAISGAVILALTLTPTLSAYAIDAQFVERENFLMRFLHRLYDPLFDLALAYPKSASFFRVLPIVLCVFLFPLLGGEFMPKLEEGNIYIRATLPMSVSFEESTEVAHLLRRTVRGCPEDANATCDSGHSRYPEILLVQSQMGRPDDGTDVCGFFNIELFAPLKSFDTFRKGVTKESLIEDIGRSLRERFPGATFNFSQMISDNVEEAVGGVKGENSIKVFGPDIERNEKYAGQIVALLSKVRGIADLGLLPSLGQPGIKVTPDRHACARYGLNTGDIDAVVQGAVGGSAVTQVYEGEQRFDLTVRWAPAFRGSIEAIRHITVATPDGMQIPLAQLARIELIEGPATVFREDGHRYAPVKFSVRGRDLAGAIGEAQSRIAKEIHLPYDTRLEWAGEIDELRHAQSRLAVIVPLSLLLIAFLAYTAVKTWLDTLIVLIDVPIACTGGILALMATGQHFSVSAAMGFVSIFGIAIQDAILVVTYFQRLHFVLGHSVISAAREASEKRFRPVLMTTLVATLGLLPAAISHGIGSQTQKPLATVVIGGSLIVAVLTRVLQPTLLVVTYKMRRGHSPLSHEEGAVMGTEHG